MTTYTEELIHSLTTLNQIAHTLNRSIDVQDALDSALSHLVELMGLETGWIFLRDRSAQTQWHGKGFVLAAHYNLPPALALNRASAWKGGCDCQGFCSKGKLTEAYNEVRCSRLEAARKEDRQGLAVHASTPLRSGDQILGILNVAAPDWDSFTPEALALLTNVGAQMGIALERARLFDLLRERRIDEQAALLELSSQFLSRSDLDDLMNYLVREVQRLLGVDASAVIMPSADGRSLVFRAATGWRFDPVSRQRRVTVQEWPDPSQVMETQRPLLMTETEKPELSRDLALGRTVSVPLALPGWLREEGFRSYAIVPLLAESRAIGTLMISCRRPRLWESDEVRFLDLMANQAAIAFEGAHLREEAMQRQRLAEELALGQRIQLSMLPRTCPLVAGWEFVAVYEVARMVGGDFYDCFDLPTGANGHSRLGLVIADVADKGVPAALFMALSRTIIRTTALSGRGPAAALTRANELILSDSQTDLFLSVVYAALELGSGRLIYANAGHNRPLWYHTATGQVSELAARGIVLGAFEDVQLQEEGIDLESGDVVLFYTDGLTEAFNSKGEMFGRARLQQVLAEAAASPSSERRQANSREPARLEECSSAQEISQAIVDAYNEFTENTEQNDDVTWLVVRRLPGKSPNRVGDLGKEMEQ